MSLREAFYKFL